MSHTTNCETCRQPYVCSGYAIDNHDGWPAVACSVCDVSGERECEDCTLADRCSWCGEFKPNEPLIERNGSHYHPDCINDAAEARNVPRV